MTHLSVLAISVLGFTGLALSMDRHQRDQFGRPLPANQTRILRWLGWLLLAVALPVALRGLGTGFGLVAWTGHVSLATAAVYVVLLARCRWHQSTR